jgi:4-hydroxymandelate oxidase
MPSTTVLGQPVSMPLMLAPTGSTYMCDPAAEFALVRATGRAGTVFALSSAASSPCEDIAAAATGPLWYQLYPPRDRSAADQLLGRLEVSGYSVLCVTIDTPLPPRRDRDLRKWAEQAAADHATPDAWRGSTSALDGEVPVREIGR